MPPELNSSRAHPCTRCRQKKVHCGREVPSCRACEQTDVNCSYPSSNGRYTISRVRSCIECRRLRARCDRKKPCASCVSSAVECRYTSAENEGANVDGEPGAGEIPTILLHELTGPQRSAATITTPDFGYPSVLLASDPFPANVTPMHPSIPQIWLLWHTYLDNVDPLYKIFHAPSFQKELLRSVQDLHTIDADIETLLFAVYFAGVVSLTVEDCMDKFKEEKLILLKRYRYALEQCLTRTLFLEKPRLTALQAFVLYITTARDAPMAVPVEALLSLAIRSATKLNLHQHQAQNPQQPLVLTTLAEKTDVELRRRLWWHIVALDVQTAEDAGIDPAIIDCTWNTRPPENMDDGELDAQSELPLPPRPGQTFDPDTYAIQSIINDVVDAEDLGRRTDMTYALTRMEIFHAFRRLNFSEHFCKINGFEYLSTRASRLEFLDDLARTLKRKYLQYCQRNDFISFFVRNATNLTLGKHLILAKRADSTQDSLRNCTHVLEAAVGLRKTQPRWAWSLRSYVELAMLETLLQCLTEISAGIALGVSVDETQIRHPRALAQSAVQRGREHDLGLCYSEQWKRIEVLWKKVEEIEGET